MFKRVRNNNRRGNQVNSRGCFAGAFIGFEVLEDRRLLSAVHGIGGALPGGAGNCGAAQGGAGTGQQIAQIAFGLIPTAAQTELDSLATTAGLTDPAATSSVTLGNVNGVETYSVTINGTGTVTTLTSDASGNPVTAPTTSSTTWGALNGSDTGSDPAAASEITAIASALDLTAPTDTTSISVVTSSAGTTTYSLKLAGTSGGDNAHSSPGMAITVFANGDPTGNQTLPFSVLPASIQTAINDNVPSGASALSADSSQSVQIQVVDGITLYSTRFTSSGTATQVTVDGAGNLTSLPAHSTTTFGALTSAEQTALQTLATAEGDTTTLASDQSVDVLTEATGVSLFSISIPITETNPAGNSVTHDETITIDSDGDPTVLPVEAVAGLGGGGQGQGEYPPAQGGGGGDKGSGGIGQGVNPGGPIQGVGGGSDDSGSCPTGSGSGSTSSSSGSSGTGSTIASGAIISTSSDTDTDSSSKKTSKKGATTKIAKVSTKKAKKSGSKKTA